QHLTFAERFFQPAPIQRIVPVWAAIALTVGVCVILNRKMRFLPVWFEPLSKVLFGLCVIGSAVFGHEGFVNHFLLLSFATPFLWILFLDGKDSSNPLPRTALVSAALLMTLQIFPIAGTQMAYASFLIVIIGVISLSDGIAQFWPAGAGHTLGIATAMIALSVFSGIWTVRSYSRYYSHTPLDLPGATRIRLPADDVEQYRAITDWLKDNCGSFVTMPGFYSLNFWTVTDPFTTQNAPSWPTLLNDWRQAEAIEALKRSPSPCAVYNPVLTEYSLRGQALSSIPLAAYIFENFEEVDRKGDYRLMVHTGDAGGK
ncbi:MAG: hypothetical protein AB7J13_05260, partial [Pyrinomonadaceae bacterium]